MPKQEIMGKIREFTGHDNIQILPSGNAAIFAAVYIAKQINKKAFFLIPDQAGWLTYKTHPKMFNIDVQQIKTNQGVIDLDDLKKHASAGTAFIYQNPAGYFAEQPMKQIYDICKKANCPVILDASGSIGTDLCNGDYADMIVSSFGRWKLINVQYGGFISAKNKTFFDEGNALYKMMKVHPSAFDKIIQKIEGLKDRIGFLEEKRKKVLEDLKEMDIIYPDKKGLNVVVRFKSMDEKEKILNYCKNNGLQYTECPRYIRVEEQAISIEIKRL
ncbi:DegT/DnrJ/EryC1/StrS family aminotransferase [Nanoarchaeota archaeon]